MVLGSEGLVLGLGIMGLGMGISVLEEGHLGFVGRRNGFWGSVGCVGTWGVGFGVWGGCLWLGWAWGRWFWACAGWF